MDWQVSDRGFYTWTGKSATRRGTFARHGVTCQRQGSTHGLVSQRQRRGTFAIYGLAYPARMACVCLYGEGGWGDMEQGEGWGGQGGECVECGEEERKSERSVVWLLGSEGDRANRPEPRSARYLGELRRGGGGGGGGGGGIW